MAKSKPKSKALVQSGEMMQVDPKVVLAEAKNAAKALQSVIAGKENKVLINGKQYLEFEDWQTLARFYGYTVGVESTKKAIDKKSGKLLGFEAVAIVLHHDKQVSRAEAACMRDEKTWSNRPQFMLRSMAQTRACAKALRNVLAWVAVLAGYKPTPAEEMQGVADENKPQRTQQKMMTDKQRGRAFKLIKELSQILGVSYEGLRKGIKKRFKTVSFSKLTAIQGKKMIEGLLKKIANEKAKSTEEVNPDDIPF